MKTSAVNVGVELNGFDFFNGIEYLISMFRGTEWLFEIFPDVVFTLLMQSFRGQRGCLKKGISSPPRMTFLVWVASRCSGNFVFSWVEQRFRG